MPLRGLVGLAVVAPREPRLSPLTGPLEDSEQPRAEHLLARAFRDNPLNVAVVGARDPARRLRSNLHGMRSLLPVARAHGEVRVARAEGEIAGVLIAAPPFAYPFPAPPLASRLRCLVGQGWRVSRRWSAVFEALDALHPVEPHWYLGTLGVEPRLQRRGIGSALLADWLDRRGRDEIATYLETDLASSVSFYAAAGFEVDGEAEILGTRVWRMRR